MKKNVVVSLLVGGAFVATSPLVYAVDTFRIQGATDAWVFSETDSAGISTVTISNGGTGAFKLFEQGGSVGAAQYCDTSGANCATPAQLANLVGSSFAEGVDNETIEVFDNAGIDILRLKDDGVGAEKLNPNDITGGLEIYNSAGNEQLRIAEGGVGATQMGDNAVDTNSIMDGQVKFDDLFTDLKVTSIDGTNGTISIPTEAAVKSYVDSAVVSASDNLGNHTATANLNVGNSAAGVAGTNFFKIVGGGTNGISIDSSGNVKVDGTMTSLSDARLKDRIEILSTPLENIKRLNGVTFYWKDSARGSGRQVGLIAQNVEQVFPELVLQNGEYKSVNYAGLVSPLIESVKALEARLVALEGKVK